MSCTLALSYFPSANNINQIAFYHYQPSTAPIAVLQISHGMNQSIEDYAAFAEFLAERDIAVVGADHLGHGKSIASPEDYGFFAASDGYRYLVEDLHTATKKAKQLYPDLPYAILGHSMGSFVARLCIAQYPDEYDAAILCGTSGAIKIIDLAIAEVALLIKEHGPHYRSKLLHKYLYRSAHAGLDGTEHTSLDWVSRDKAVVNRYLKSPHAAFVFTLSAIKDLFTLIKQMSTKEWFADYPKALPTYIISGENDPVGQFTHGVQQVTSNLKAAGAQKIVLKIYPECKHELLGELNKDEVFIDIFYFLTDAMNL